MIAQRKAKALIMFEQALCNTVPRGIGHGVLQVLKSVNTMMYERKDPIDAADELKRRESLERERKIKASLAQGILSIQK